MSEKHWIVTDMDDTMIKHYGKPSDRVRNLWNYLSENKNNYMVVATGQSHIKVLDKFFENGLAVPDYIISNQGTVICRPKTDEIMKVFWMSYSKVLPVLNKFYEMGGEEKFIRVCTLSKVIVLDCEESRSFYEKNPQSNVEFTTSIRRVIKKAQYTKLVLAAPFEVVEKMLLYKQDYPEVTLINSGTTDYGGDNYYRLEIAASDKEMALDALISYWKKSHKTIKGIDFLGLGDEITDFGIAKMALKVNSMANSTGYFAIIDSGSKGNASLVKELDQMCNDTGFKTHLIYSESVEQDGWAKAILKWQNLV